MARMDLPLFDALQTSYRALLNDRQSQSDRQLLVYPASESERLAESLFANLDRGGFCTHVVAGRSDWDPESHYYEAARAAARRGRTIERAFLLPHRHARHDPTLALHLDLDRASGIKTHVIYVGELISTLSLPVADNLEFGLWDDAVACVGRTGPTGLSGGIAEWRITTRPEDVQLLQELQREFLTTGQSLDVLHDPEGDRDLEEPMITTAPIADELAQVMCQGDHVSPDDCSWYHAVWQYLRIFDMVSTPTWHAKFFFDALQECALQCDGPNVLVSGTADYSMLAHSMWALDAAGTNAQFTVLDLCETPLFLCKWYGKAVGKPVRTVATNLLDMDGDGQFDLIVTDAFLTRFSESDRSAVVAKWHSLLRTGGSVVTTARIETIGGDSDSVGADIDQVSKFERRALVQARRWQGFLRRPPERVASLARVYAERMRSHSIASRDELANLFAAGGFDVTRLDLAEVTGEMAPTVYGELVAVAK